MPVAPTLVSSSQYELVYTFTTGGADTSTIPYTAGSTPALTVDAIAGSPLAAALAAVSGQCGGAGEATAAVVTGAGFTGTGTGTPALRTYIQTRVVPTTALAAGVNGAAAANNPTAVAALGAAGTAYVYVTLRHSIVR
jgi:hypothetical protein